ncbi:MAG: SRPBCC family protein [Kordiimonas sp.]
MRRFEIQIDIKAQKEKVWEALVDFESYPNWNPTLTYVEGHLKSGEILHARFGRARNLTAADVEQVEEGNMFVMSRSLIHPYLVHMAHDFELQEIEGGVTQFIQRWHCKGMLVPFLWSKMTTGMLKFERFNRGLKSYIEGH